MKNQALICLKQDDCHEKQAQRTSRNPTLLHHQDRQVNGSAVVMSNFVMIFPRPHIVSICEIKQSFNSHAVSIVSVFTFLVNRSILPWPLTRDGPEWRMQCHLQNARSSQLQ